VNRPIVIEFASEPKRAPLIRAVHRAPEGIGSRVQDAGCGDDCEDPSGVLSRQEADQADLPRVAGIAEDGAEGRSVGRDGVHLRAQGPAEPKIGPWRGDLDDLLAENARRPKRERLTQIRIFEELRALGYDGGYDAVRRYAAAWSKAETEASAAAYVPLSFDPGQAYQFDWSHEIVLIDGVTTTVKVAHVRLCHSRMPFVRAYPRETQEMVFDAHDRAFAFFGGACARGIYDNMKTAVDTIFVGKDRAYNRRFQEMCGHYLVEPVACTPASGWEKGQVENQVAVIRRRFFVPRPRFRSYAELNAWLMDRCIAWARANPHPELRDKTVWEVFQEERPSLVPYVGPFNGFHAVPATVSKTCLVRFDKNRYLVEVRAVGRPVEIRAYAEHVEFWQNGQVVSQHPRAFGRDKAVYDPLHYIPVLAPKPGALRNGAPFKEWELPPSMRRVQRRLGRLPNGDRQMVDILGAILTDGLDAVEAACAEALRRRRSLGRRDPQHPRPAP